ncbi:MAG: hypothetical protein WBK77_10490 [Alphaproteobacteria bacterium]
MSKNDTPPPPGSIKRYPAQKTLQMKAGTGEVDQTIVASAEKNSEKLKDYLADDVKKLSTALNRQITELEKVIEQEAFVAAPEKQTVINEIVQTMMNFKSLIGYTNATQLSNLTSFVLATLDDAEKMTPNIKDALREYNFLLHDYVDNSSSSPSEDDIKKVTALWQEIKKTIKTARAEK